MAGVGESLKKARLDRGLTLEDVERLTRIRVRYIKALEDEAFDILPGQAYTKGFLRTYARHLDLNIEELLPLLPDSVANPEDKWKNAVQVKPIRTKPIWLKPAISVAMAVCALIVVVSIAHFTHASAGEEPLLLPNPPFISASDDDARSSFSIEYPDAPPTDTQPPENVPPVQQPATGVTVQITGKQDCWMDVRADGEQVIYGVVLAGETKEIKAKDAVTFVTIGNAPGIQIAVNGIVQPSLGVNNQTVVNNITYSKEP
ncbi:MAG: DUF4115 domain-containing protein [Peptococcaceae bacterium]|jgi:cytoskeletal protein RodZ|nr:DUF4115 domain-containing protein [Peptococcaceae bacterium]